MVALIQQPVNRRASEKNSGGNNNKSTDPNTDQQNKVASMTKSHKIHVASRLIVTPLTNQPADKAKTN